MSPTLPRPKSILWIEDDVFSIQVHSEFVRDAGYTIVVMRDASSGIDYFEHNRGNIGCVILDLAMEAGPRFTAIESAGGLHAGLAVARGIHAIDPACPLIALTISDHLRAAEWFKDRGFPYLQKQKTPPRLLVEYVRRVTVPGYRPKILAFIVHGHDEPLLIELKEFVEKSLGLEPIVLRDRPSRGRTIIEKFEDEASEVAVAFVLLTPDDPGIDPSSDRRRARPNVIFELGYFLAKLERRSGRVILLYKDKLDIPSDISGVVYVDVSKGIAASSAAIRAELDDLL